MSGRQGRLPAVIAAIERFFLAPASPLPLAVLRMGLAAVLLAQAALLGGTFMDFLSSRGMIQGELARALGDPSLPQIGWLVGRLAPWHFSEAACIQGVCLAYVFSLLLLFFGLSTRLASISSWFLHWVLMATTDTTSYGADLYAHVVLFYLMWLPSGEALSLDSVRRGGAHRSGSSSGARLGLRLIQLHLCLTYLLSGLEKAQGEQWWNGELLWRAMTLPVYRQFDMSWLAFWPMLSRVGGWGTLVLEIGYCVMIWPRRTRPIWVASITALHLGIAVLLGLGVFGSLMAVLTLSVFGVSAEPAGQLTARSIGDVPDPALALKS